MSACRSCDAEVLWARTPQDKAIPIDPEPVEGGNIVLHDPVPGRPRTCHFVGRGTPSDGPRYVSHFTTCPNAAQHRRPRKAQERWRDLVGGEAP